MLYDNALLSVAYLEAWKYLKKPSYKETVTNTLEYILHEMTHPLGGFYSAEDADSEGVEGKYYTWTKEQIDAILPLEEAALFCQYYGVAASGNFEGGNVLYIPESLEELAISNKLPKEEIERLLSSARVQVLKKRRMRSRPLKDDKIIVSFNGLMIDAMIRASCVLDRKEFREAALKAASFIKEHLWQEGRLLRRWREDEARFLGTLDDYACLIKGLISLFEQRCGSDWLQWAIELASVVEKEFKAEGGAFYYNLADPSLLLRRFEFYDSAEPSANAVHCENLLRLHQITSDEKYLAQAEDILKASKHYIESHPSGACYHLLCLLRYLDLKRKTLIVALNKTRDLENQIRQVLNHRFIPHLSVIWQESGDALLSTLIPSLVDKKPIDGQTTVYMCRQTQCLPPLLNESEIIQALESL